MKVIGLNNINHKKSHIVYIRHFTAEAVIELPNMQENVPVNFEIEMDCFGNKQVRVDILKEINYPTIPLKKSVCDYIRTQDEEGKLPC